MARSAALGPRRPPDPARAPDPARSPGPVLEFLRTLWRTNHALEQLSRAMEDRLGVTAQQRLALRCIGATEGATGSTLAEFLHLDPSTVSIMLARLEKRGLVARARDAADGRRVTVKLTAEGRALTRARRGTVEGAVAALLESSTDAELDELRQQLERFAAFLDAEREAR